MFTFNSQTQPNKLKGTVKKVGPLPQIAQTQPLFPLPPLPFYIEAVEPLPLSYQFPLRQSRKLEQIQNEKQKQKLQQQVEQYLKDRNRIDFEYSQLRHQYQRVSRQNQEIKAKYREGQHLFMQLEAQNMRIFNELQTYKNKKNDKSRISVGIKKKQIPVVKINVPNTKILSNNMPNTNNTNNIQQSQKQSTYRQLKSASQQIIYMRKILQSQKQKSEYNQIIMNKNMQQIVSQRDSLKNQMNSLRQQNRMYKDEINKLKTASLLNNVSKPYRDSFNNTELDHIKTQYQRLERIHKSCDILLKSKQTQIIGLKSDIDKLNANISASKYQIQKNITIQRTPQSKSLFSNNINYMPSSFIYQKEADKPIKQRLQYGSMSKDSQLYILSNTNTLYSYKNKPSAQNGKQSQEQNQFLRASMMKQRHRQQHTTNIDKNLKLSATQMGEIDQFIKNIISQFIDKNKQLTNQLQRANKTAQHRKFQLDRVYELLQHKKQELENCYKDLRNFGKNSISTPVKQKQDNEQFMKSLLKDRRNSMSS